MIKRIRVTAIMMAMGLSTMITATTAEAGGLQLASDGQARAVIVLPDDANAAERTAATELSEHLRRMTGADFLVYSEADAADVDGARILVGPSAAARALFKADELDALTGDAFRIRTADNAIALVGGRPRGSLYAVYSFLENDLGVRWLNWFDDVYLPRYRDINILSIDRHELPAFAVRDILVRTNRTTAWDDLRNFLVRNKCQGPELMFMDNIEAYGGVSHRYVIDPVRPNSLLVHTLHQFVSPRDYFDEHPEYFSYDASRKRRVRDRHLCFSNPDLVALLNKKVLAAIKKNGGRGIVSISAMDVSNLICECPKCKAVTKAEGTGGAPLLKYIAEELSPVVAKRYPEAIISTLAYRQSAKAPAKLRFPKNVLIVWAPIGADFAHPFSHPNNAELLKEFKGWAAVAPTMWIWYYPEPYRQPLAMGNLSRYAKDFQLFREYGVKGLFIESDSPGLKDRRRLSSLNQWVMTKLMWDPDQDVDLLIEDFVGHFYGPAAPMMLEYIMDLEAATASAGFMGWNANLDSFRFMDAARLKHWQELFDRAMKATAHSPQFAAHTANTRMSVDHATLRTWTLQGLDTVMPVSRDVIAQRYIDTYEQANRDRRIDPKRKGWADKAYAQTMTQLRSFSGLKPFKPLPPPLADVAPERVHQLSPDGVFIKLKDRSTLDLVKDPDAAGGIAVRFKYAAGKTLRIGHYEGESPKGAVISHEKTIRPDEVADTQYHLYHISRSRLSDAGYVYARGWQIQFHDTKYLFDPNNPDRMYDIYASIKITPPDADAVSDNAPYQVWIDRIVLVEVDADTP